MSVIEIRQNVTLCCLAQVARSIVESFPGQGQGRRVKHLQHDGETTPWPALSRVLNQSKSAIAPRREPLVASSASLAAGHRSTSNSSQNNFSVTTPHVAAVTLAGGIAWVLVVSGRGGCRLSTRSGRETTRPAMRPLANGDTDDGGCGCCVRRWRSERWTSYTSKMRK